MRNKRKFTYFSILILLVLFLIIIVYVFSIVRNAFPDYNRDVYVSHDTIKDVEVDIYRDQWGVAQIYASDDYALFFAQGYIQSQDRLLQMELNRCTGKGELSKYFGENLLGSDIYMRTMGLERSAQLSLELQDEETMKLINAYVDGVNYYIETNKNNLSAELKIMGITPEEWTAADVITSANVTVLYMSYNYLFETLRAELIANFDEDIVNELFLYENDKPVIVPEGVDQYRNFISGQETSQIGLYENYHNRWGSNNWVISGKLTKSKKPILANDTHTDLALPSTWYEIGLHSPNYQVSGYSLVGVPWIIIGHNQKIAWGITNGTADVQDLYLEKLDDPQSPKKYYFKDEWHDIQVVKETFYIRGKDPIEKNIYFTNHGPIVNDALDYSLLQPVSLRWTLWEGNTMFGAMDRVNRAENWSEFRDALKGWNNAAQNFVYADVEGNIGLQNTSKVPIRSTGHQGLLPVPGWTGEYEWQGYVPYEKMPYIFNPEEGYIATANNNISLNEEIFISDDWCKDYRVDRIKSLIQKNSQMTIDDMKAIQNDSYSVIAEELVPYITQIDSDSLLVGEGVKLLKNWDYDMDSLKAEPLLFDTWYRCLLENVLNSRLKYESDPFYQPRNRFMDYSDNHYYFMSTIMKDENNSWFDDLNTEVVEKREQAILSAMLDALDYLNIKNIEDFKKLKWGDYHKITFKNMAFGNIGVSFIERIVNSPTYGFDGSLSTVNVGSYTWDKGYDIDFGTSQRVIIDLADFDSTASINSTGQTEHIFHKNRLDQMPIWAEGDYKVSPFSKEKIEEVIIDRMKLIFE